MPVHWRWNRQPVVNWREKGAGTCDSWAISPHERGADRETHLGFVIQPSFQEVWNECVHGQELLEWDIDARCGRR